MYGGSLIFSTPSIDMDPGTDHGLWLSPARQRGALVESAAPAQRSSRSASLAAAQPRQRRSHGVLCRALRPAGGSALFIRIHTATGDRAPNQLKPTWRPSRIGWRRSRRFSWGTSRRPSRR